jgi:hypothetical protein
MDDWTGLEVIAWWLIALDAILYNLVAWAGAEWYESKFPGLARIFPATKAFGLLYGGLVAWLGFALIRPDVPLFGS